MAKETTSRGCARHPAVVPDHCQIVDELIVTDYIDHNPPLPDTAPGREGVKQTNAILRRGFSDVEHSIRDQIAEGDKVATRVTVSATDHAAHIKR